MLRKSRTAAAVIIAVAFTLCLPGKAPGKGKGKEGTPLPQFSAMDMDGKEVDTRKLAGKTIILDFWSIYCSSCIQEMPHIVNLYNKYKDMGLRVIGIDLDVYGSKRVKKFIKGLDFTIPYPNIIDKKMEIKKALGVSMLPTTVLIDPEGIIQLYHIGYKPGFETHLEELVKKYLPAQ